MLLASTSPKVTKCTRSRVAQSVARAAWTRDILLPRLRGCCPSFQIGTVAADARSDAKIETVVTYLQESPTAVFLSNQTTSSEGEAAVEVASR